MGETGSSVPGGKSDEEWETMTHEELEVEYSPSRHSPYQRPDAIIPAYLDKVKRDLALSKDQVPWKTYAVGSSDSSLLMDVYGEDLNKEAPLLVFVHGGYWQELSKELVGGLMGPLHQAGVMTAVLSYTLAPKGSVPQMVHEVERGLLRCVELVRERGGRTIVVAGWSAGAQLVVQALSARVDRIQTISPDPPPAPPTAVVGTHDHHDTVGGAEPHPCPWPEVKGVLGISGIYDLRPLVTTYVNDPLKLTRTSAWQLSPARPCSCRALVSALPPSARCLVAVAQYDSPQFRRQSEQYAARLRAAGLGAVEEHLVTASDHFKIISDLADQHNPFMTRIVQFIQECHQGNNNNNNDT